MNEEQKPFRTAIYFRPRPSSQGPVVTRTRPTPPKPKGPPRAFFWDVWWPCIITGSCQPHRSLTHRPIPALFRTLLFRRPPPPILFHMVLPPTPLHQHHGPLTTAVTRTTPIPTQEDAAMPATMDAVASEAVGGPPPQTPPSETAPDENATTTVGTSVPLPKREKKQRSKATNKENVDRDLASQLKAMMTKVLPGGKKTSDGGGANGGEKQVQQAPPPKSQQEAPAKQIDVKQQAPPPPTTTAKKEKAKEPKAPREGKDQKAPRGEGKDRKAPREQKPASQPQQRPKKQEQKPAPQQTQPSQQQKAQQLQQPMPAQGQKQKPTQPAPAPQQQPKAQAQQAQQQQREKQSRPHHQQQQQQQQQQQAQPSRATAPPPRPAPQAAPVPTPTQAAATSQRMQQHLANMVVECLPLPPALHEWTGTHAGELNTILAKVKEKANVLSIVLDRVGGGEHAKNGREKQDLVITAMGGEEAQKAKALLELHIKNQQQLWRTEQRLMQVQEEISAVHGAVAAGLRIEFAVSPELTGVVIGKQGSRINSVRAESGVDSINIGDDGIIRVVGPTNASVLKARELLELVQEDFPVSPDVYGWLSRPMIGDVRDKSGCVVVRAIHEEQQHQQYATAVRMIGTRKQVENARLLLETQVEYVSRHQALRSSEQQMLQKLEMAEFSSYSAVPRSSSSAPPSSFASAQAAPAPPSSSSFPPLGAPSSSSTLGEPLSTRFSRIGNGGRAPGGGGGRGGGGGNRPPPQQGGGGGGQRPQAATQQQQQQQQRRPSNQQQGPPPAAAVQNPTQQQGNRGGPKPQQEPQQQQQPQPQQQQRKKKKKNGGDGKKEGGGADKQQEGAGGGEKKN